MFRFFTCRNHTPENSQIEHTENKKLHRGMYVCAIVCTCVHMYVCNNVCVLCLEKNRGDPDLLVNGAFHYRL